MGRASAGGAVGGHDAHGHARRRWSIAPADHQRDYSSQRERGAGPDHLLATPALRVQRALDAGVDALPPARRWVLAEHRDQELVRRPPLGLAVIGGGLAIEKIRE